MCVCVRACVRKGMKVRIRNLRLVVVVVVVVLHEEVSSLPYSHFRRTEVNKSSYKILLTKKMNFRIFVFFSLSIIVAHLSTMIRSETIPFCSSTLPIHQSFSTPTDFKNSTNLHRQSYFSFQVLVA